MTMVDIVNIEAGPQYGRLEEELAAIHADFVGTKMDERNILTIRHRAQRAVDRWFPGVTTFVLVEPDIVTRSVKISAWDPAYRHDCDACAFLGRYSHEGREADLYRCDRGPGLTYIARFSDEPADYTSGLGFAEAGYPPLREAMRRDAPRKAGV